MSALNSARYSRRTALLFERVYGEGYQGPSDPGVFARLSDRGGIAASDVVLDAGCGLGGDARRLAHEQGATVIGADISADLVEVCQERLPPVGAAPGRLCFVHADITRPVCPDGAVTVVWSKDCLFLLEPHLKVAALEAFYRQLRPGGRMLLTDYTSGQTGTSPSFDRRMRDWNHSLWDQWTYREAVRAAGFVDVRLEDQTEDLEVCMRAGRVDLLARREHWVAELGAETWTELLDRWTHKERSCAQREIRWTLVLARRPSDEAAVDG